MFFFEKKNQKTFVFCLAETARARFLLAVCGLEPVRCASHPLAHTVKPGDQPHFKLDDSSARALPCPLPAGN
jgi:hypothetical protein